MGKALNSLFRFFFKKEMKACRRGKMPNEFILFMNNKLSLSNLLIKNYKKIQSEGIYIS